MLVENLWRRRAATYLALALTSIFGAYQVASAGTILKLDLGSDASFDVEFDGTTFSTVNDGNALTTGDQNTDVDFGDFLSATPDILSSSASLSFNGLTRSGAPTVIGGSLVVQPFSGGTISVFDPANLLLLSGTLANSVLTGPIGPPATGALFTTSFATVTGGSLAPLLAPGSLSLSMSLTDVNGGAGLSVTGGAQSGLSPFNGDATLNVAAEQRVIPEPAGLLLAGLALGGMIGARLRK